MFFTEIRDGYAVLTLDPPDVHALLRLIDELSGATSNDETSVALDTLRATLEALLVALTATGAEKTARLSRLRYAGEVGSRVFCTRLLAQGSIAMADDDAPAPLQPADIAVYDPSVRPGPGDLAVIGPAAAPRVVTLAPDQARASRLVLGAVVGFYREVAPEAPTAA